MNASAFSFPQVKLVVVIDNTKKQLSEKLNCFDFLVVMKINQEYKDLT